MISKKMRPIGISAVLRCKNEEEYITASILSAYRVFDEFIVVLNDSTDSTRGILADLSKTYAKIQVYEYNQACSPAGVGYLDKVRQDPDTSLSKYYNWSFRLSKFSHVCKWDGDMVALPTLSQVRDLLTLHDLILFDGYDAVGEHTTELEPRIYRYDPEKTFYEDWDLYEVLKHNYSTSYCVEEKCYVHMKLVKREWQHKPWSNPNDYATEAFPAPNRNGSDLPVPVRFVRSFAGVIWRAFVRVMNRERT